MEEEEERERVREGEEELLLLVLEVSSSEVFPDSVSQEVVQLKKEVDLLPFLLL